MITCTRIFEFDAAHRVLKHESKCKNLHGHRYKAEVTVMAPELDSLGRVIDFGDLKKVVGSWIDHHWDHTAIFNEEDPLINVILQDTEADKDPYIMAGNPTAENMVKELFKVSSDLLSPYSITVVKIRLYETPNCWAECEGEPL